MMAHLVLSQIVRYRIGWSSDLAMDLFAVPNSAISPDYGFRLLRLKYWPFWLETPDEMAWEGAVTRSLLWLTQVSGLLTFIGFMGFVLSPFFLLWRSS